MANRKISDLAALTAPATGDLLPIVDISEAAAADKNKKITFGELLSSAPAGSAAAPSFSFDADPNTGILNPAADTLAFAKGGVEAMRIDSSGRVGIGMSSPLNRLHVASSISALPTFDDLTTSVGCFKNTYGNTTNGTTAYTVLRLRRDGEATVTYGSTVDFAIARYEAVSANSRTRLDIRLGHAFTDTVDTTVMSLLSSGAVLVGTTTANTSGAKLQTSDGLTFPATQVASADPNTLDDYEEGTWTPSVGGTATYSSRSGSYVKIGSLVFAQFDITINVLGTGTQTIGAPFTGTGNASGSIGYYYLLATTIISLRPYIGAGGTIYFANTSSAAITSANLPTTIFADGSRVQGSIVYIV